MRNKMPRLLSEAGPAVPYICFDTIDKMIVVACRFGNEVRPVGKNFKPKPDIVSGKKPESYEIICQLASCLTLDCLPDLTLALTEDGDLVTRYQKQVHKRNPENLLDYEHIPDPPEQVEIHKVLGPLSAKLLISDDPEPLPKPHYPDGPDHRPAW